MKNIDNPALYPMLPEPPEKRSTYMSLRPAEKAFVDGYIATLATSANTAARSIAEIIGVVGVDNSDRARRMLLKDYIRAAIEERARQVCEKFEVNTNSLIREIANIAYANMGNYLHITADGDPYIDLANCTFDQMSAIKSITVEDYKEGRGEDARDVRKVKLELHDKQVAQEKLMRFKQMYAPETLNINHNVMVKSLNVNMTSEQLAELYQRRIKGE
jgi:phage terminase small subunit